MSTALSIYYLYRDADNYKRHGKRVFSNPSCVSADQLWLALTQAFMPLQSFPDVVNFDPAKLGWDELFFPDHDLSAADVSFHELASIEASSDEPDTVETIDDLLERLSILR